MSLKAFHLIFVTVLSSLWFGCGIWKLRDYSATHGSGTLGFGIGALALGVTIMGTILAAMTGIIGASVTMMTALALPTMMKQGYSHALACGTIAAAGTLEQPIPPIRCEPQQEAANGFGADTPLGQIYSTGFGFRRCHEAVMKLLLGPGEDAVKRALVVFGPGRRGDQLAIRVRG